MIGPVYELEKILTKELELYETIYSIEMKKQQAILEREGKELESLSMEQEKLISIVTNLEKDRLKQIELYRLENNLNDLAENLSLKNVIASMDEDSSHHLLRIGMDLKDLLIKLQVLQKTNGQLLQDNVEFYDILLTSLREGASEEAGYSDKGKEEGKVADSLIFNQTA